MTTTAPTTALVSNGLWHSFESPHSWMDIANIGSAIATGVAALLTALVLVFTVIGLWQNRRQIKAGEEDSRRQQKNLEVQQTMLGEQNNLLAQQAVNTPFFNLLDMLQSIVDSTEVSVRTKTVRGRAAFKELYAEFRPQGLIFSQQNPPPEKKPWEERRQELSEMYKHFHRKHSNELSHYFRSLYTIVRYLDEAGMSEGVTRNYMRMVRGQMSQDQLMLLFYNGLTDEHGYPKFFNLIKQHRLLENMDTTQLMYEADKDIYWKLPVATWGEVVA